MCLVYWIAETALLSEFGEVTHADEAALWDIITGRVEDLIFSRGTDAFLWTTSESNSKGNIQN